MTTTHCSVNLQELASKHKKQKASLFNSQDETQGNMLTLSVLCILS